MNNEQRLDYITRDRILRLLSDDEVARVCNAETKPSLTAGDEYVDLESPHHGVEIAAEGATSSMGSVLPRKAVEEKSWSQIVALLSQKDTAKRGGDDPKLAWNQLHALADEIRVQLHIAGMDAKDKWKRDLEPRFVAMEKRVEGEVGAAIHIGLHELRAAMQTFRASLKKVS